MAKLTELIAGFCMHPGCVAILDTTRRSVYRLYQPITPVTFDPAQPRGGGVSRSPPASGKPFPRGLSYSTIDCTTRVLNVDAYHSRCCTDCIMYTPTSSSFGSTQKNVPA
jgi:hypothetical protein